MEKPGKSSKEPNFAPLCNRESFTWIIREAILWLVLDSKGIQISTTYTLFESIRYLAWSTNPLRCLVKFHWGVPGRSNEQGDMTCICHGDTYMPYAMDTWVAFQMTTAYVCQTIVRNGSTLGDGKWKAKWPQWKAEFGWTWQYLFVIPSTENLTWNSLHSTKHETKTRNPWSDAKVLAPNYVNM